MMMDDLTKELRKIAQSLLDGPYDKDEAKREEDAKWLSRSKAEAKTSLDAAVKFLSMLEDEPKTMAVKDAIEEVVDHAIKTHKREALRRLPLVELLGVEGAVDKAVYASEVPGLSALDSLEVLDGWIKGNQIDVTDLSGHHEAGNVQFLVEEAGDNAGKFAWVEQLQDSYARAIKGIEAGDLSPADLFMTNKSKDEAKRKEVARLSLLKDVVEALDHTHVLDVLSKAEVIDVLGEMSDEQREIAEDKIRQMRI
jgi:hypothetical protein